MTIPNSAVGIFTCACGESITVPLRLGPGNDFTADFPDGWYPGFGDDGPHIRCPEHNKFNVIYVDQVTAIRRHSDDA